MAFILFVTMHVIAPCNLGQPAFIEQTTTPILRACHDIVAGIATCTRLVELDIIRQMIRTTAGNK
jgi:hypothetical protein